MHSPQIIYKINERDRDLYFFYPPAEALKVVHCCNKFKETKSNQDEEKKGGSTGVPRGRKKWKKVSCNQKLISDSM